MGARQFYWRKVQEALAPVWGLLLWVLGSLLVPGRKVQVWVDSRLQRTRVSRELRFYLPRSIPVLVYVLVAALFFLWVF